MALRLNEFIPHEPTDKQAAFLCLDCEEAFYGGAGGGGKSEALLMAALQYVDVPGYSAGLFRRHFADLEKPDGLVDLSHEFLNGTRAQWNGFKKQWLFPTRVRNRPAKLTFGGHKMLSDTRRYGSSQYQYEGFDELTDFERGQYMFMRTRLRRRLDVNVPLRIRSGGNPGGVGHAWVKKRMLLGRGRFNRIFVKALLTDNPHIDREAYIRTLEHLPPVLRARILNGDWEVYEEGQVFRRIWFDIIDELPAGCDQGIRYWDLAATEKRDDNEPAWTVGALMFAGKNLWPLADVKKIRGTPGDVEDFILQTARVDREKYGRRVVIGLEQEPGSGGVNTVSYYRRLLAGFHVHFDKKGSGDSKILRANPVATQAQAKRIPFLNGRWNESCLDELEVFPGGRFKDQVDAISGAFAYLTRKNRMRHKKISWLERASRIPTRRPEKARAIIQP